MNRWVRKSVSVLLAAVMALGMAGAAFSAGGEAADSGGYSYNTAYVSERIANNYTKVSAGYTFPAYTGADVVVNAADAVTPAGSDKITGETLSYGKADKVLNLVFRDEVTLTVNVPKDGLYDVKFDYLSYDESVLPVKFGLTVDGDYPFYECRTL
ncbi:MAG: extracellular solute-binding protein, partial [bacterium]